MLIPSTFRDIQLAHVASSATPPDRYFKDRMPVIQLNNSDMVCVYTLIGHSGCQPFLWIKPLYLHCLGYELMHISLLWDTTIFAPAPSEGRSLPGNPENYLQIATIHTSKWLTPRELGKLLCQVSPIWAFVT